MKKKIYIYGSILFLGDFLIKLLIKNMMNILESITVIPNFFSITYVINDGAAFSILKGKQIFLILLASIFLFFLIYSIKEEKLTKYKMIYYSFLIGGIFGNLVDRIIYNGVIDYLDFQIFIYDAPIFNLADIFIFIGVVLILLEGGEHGNRIFRKRYTN